MADFCLNASPKITSDPRTRTFEFYDVSTDRAGFAAHSQRETLGGCNTCQKGWRCSNIFCTWSKRISRDNIKLSWGVDGRERERRVLEACCKQYLSLEDVISAPKCIKFPSAIFYIGFNAQLRQMSSIQIPHPDPNSLARLLGHKPTKKVPEILWRLYSVERLKLGKNWLTRV